MILKILNLILIFFAVFMGVKQGYAMLSLKPEMWEMFNKWGFNKYSLMINGGATLLAACMILFPRTFVFGNFFMAAGILLIICFHLHDRNFKGAIIELPFLLLNLLIIYLRYPLAAND